MLLEVHLVNQLHYFSLLRWFNRRLSSQFRSYRLLCLQLLPLSLIRWFNHRWFCPRSAI